MAEDVLFLVSTPLGFDVRTSRAWWEFIATDKHPTLAGQLEAIRDTLEHPDEVRRSTSDDSVYLFYQAEDPGRWLCVVVKRLDSEGFLITAYPTDGIKVGELLWNR